MNSFISHNNVMRQIILTSFFRWVNWGTKRWSSFPSLCKYNMVELQTEVYWLTTLSIYFYTNVICNEKYVRITHGLRKQHNDLVKYATNIWTLLCSQHHMASLVCIIKLTCNRDSYVGHRSWSQTTCHSEEEHRQVN